MEYPKIETLFDRDEKFKVIEGALRLPEFAIPKTWLVTEKIDGTNVRVAWDGEAVRYHGRTDNAQMPTFLLTYLQDTFTAEKLATAFPEATDVWLYGEGYGAKIQSGGNYRPNAAVRLFDVRVGAWWLNWANVVDVAQKLGIENAPVINACADLSQIAPIVRNLASIVAQFDSGQESDAEGVVCRTDPLLFTRKGERLMFKLKARDFVGAAR